MAYTNNVPQANQTIAASQPQIQANFGFIQTDAQVEHSFNGTPGGVAEGVHLKASMPNMADPSSLPAGTNGMYYVNGSNPKFYNGTVSFLQTGSIKQNIATGTVALTTSPTSVFNVPAFSSGSYFLIPPMPIDSDDASAMGQMVTGNTSIQLATNSDPGISITSSGTTIRAQTTSGSFNGTYKYLVVYYTP